MHETEISSPVSLTLPDGTLNPDALGWTRQPHHDTSGIGASGRGLRWGRDKRWEYWAVMTPDLVLALTVSDIDYLRLDSVWLLNRTTGEEIEQGSLLPGLPGPPHGRPGRGAHRAPGALVDGDATHPLQGSAEAGAAPRLPGPGSTPGACVGPRGRLELGRRVRDRRWTPHQDP